MKDFLQKFLSEVIMGFFGCFFLFSFGANLFRGLLKNILKFFSAAQSGIFLGILSRIPLKYVPKILLVIPPQNVLEVLEGILAEITQRNKN